MISTEEFSLIFRARHNFNWPDKAFLPNNYPNICFKNIPEAWMAAIDNTLVKIKDTSKISSISQLHGFVSIQHSSSNKKHKDLLSKLEKDLMLIDLDLHNKLGECNVLI